MKPRHSTIEWVVRRQLCTGCGTCAGICPRDAIHMIIDRRRGNYVPDIQADRCNRCGLCYQVCPGRGVDFDGLGGILFPQACEEVALGRYLGCYSGHANDADVRYNSASGGLVTALLIFALEEGLIDGALVTQMVPDRPLEPLPFIARTKEQIVAAAGSKYCPVAANAALREILDSKGKFAVVGLPCHVQGLRKAERCIEGLTEKIRYRIAVTCSLDYSFFGTERFLQSIDVLPSAVQTLEYRGRGWPGSMLVRLNDGTETTIPLEQYFSALRPFSLRRCTLCSDMLGELSDLSCGDAWIPQIVKADKLGTSFAITRTPEAEELLEAAAFREIVELSECGPKELSASQGHAIFKKRKLVARMRLFRLTRQSVPKYRQKLLKLALSDYTKAAKFYIARWILSSENGFLHTVFRAARSSKRRNQESA
jgi:coenzyme F420 hydrogenase subunit beta